jgi:hypothetical protein
VAGLDEQQPGERPRWSFTWLLRIQRVGRNRRVETSLTDADGEPKMTAFWKAVPWIILLALGVEIAIGVWLDLIPR